MEIIDVMIIVVRTIINVVKLNVVEICEIAAAAPVLVF